MKMTIKSLALVGIVAMCLVSMPALSAPANGGAAKPQSNESEMGNCNAFQHGMWNPEMGPMGHPGMMYGKDAFEKNKSSKYANWNKTQTIEIRKAGIGFATSGNDNHVLRLNVEGNIKPDFADIKKLISDNKTLGQIKSEIKAKRNAEIAAASFNGSLHIGQSDYNLINIKLTPSGDNSTAINADVAGPKVKFTDKPTNVVGHVTVTTSRQDNETIGVGNLTINSGKSTGQYKVLINMGGHGKGKHMGIHNCIDGGAFDGINHGGESFGMDKETPK